MWVSTIGFLRGICILQSFLQENISTGISTEKNQEEYKYMVSTLKIQYQGFHTKKRENKYTAFYIQIYVKEKDTRNL